MAKGKRDKKKKKKGAQPGPKPVRSAAPAGEDEPARPGWPKVSLVQALVGLGLIALWAGVFALLPIDIVHSKGGRALVGLVAGSLGAASALFWGLDLVAIRCSGRGGRRRIVLLGSSLLFPPMMALGMVLMHDSRVAAIPALVLGAAMLLHLAFNESGRTGDPAPPGGDG